MNSTNQTEKEHSEGIQAYLEALPPAERVRAKTIVNLGNVILALLNVHDWQAIEGMSAVCNDLFAQAAEIQNEVQKHRLQ